MIDPSIIADYEKWLHAVANRLTDQAGHDDLVQEGRVAMWRALSTYEEEKGALPSWLVRAAEMRMKDVAWGKGQPFGHEPVRGSREVEMGASLDAIPEAVVEALLGFVEAAYQEGEILDAVRSLPPREQEYVFLRFWGGLSPLAQGAQIKALVADHPVISESWRWQKAKRRLAEKLAHLAA